MRHMSPFDRRLYLTLACIAGAWACASSQVPATTPAVEAAATEPAPVEGVAAAPKEAPPGSGPAREVNFPTVVRSQTKSGLEVNAVSMNALPTVDLKLVIRSGSASDPKNLPGVAKLVAEMLKEGTKKHTSAQIAERVDFLGARLWVDNDEENIYVQMRALAEHLDEAMDLIAEVTMRPAFSDAEFKKLKVREADSLALSEKDPNFLAAREFFKRLYGEHPYANIDTNLDVLKRVRTTDLKAYHLRHFAPNNAFLVGVGAVTVEQLQTAAERAFRGWAKRKISVDTYPEVPTRQAREVVIVDRPQSVQSVFFIGNLALDRKSPDYIPLLLANQVLGGSAASRLFMDLREKQSLTYGAYSRVYESVGVAPFRAYAAVRNEVTEQAMSAFMKHLNQIRQSAAPPTELAAAKRFLVDQLPLRLDTAKKVADLIADLRVYDLPDDYWQKFRQQVEAVTAEQALVAAQKYIDADHALVVVVGKAAAVKDTLMKYGDVLVIDSEGQVVTDVAAPAAAPTTTQATPATQSTAQSTTAGSGAAGGN